MNVLTIIKKKMTKQVQKKQLKQLAVEFAEREARIHQILGSLPASEEKMVVKAQLEIAVIKANAVIAKDHDTWKQANIMLKKMESVLKVLKRVADL